MNEDQAVPGRLRWWGFTLLMLFLSFFGFISPKSAGVIVPLATLLVFGGWLVERGSLAILRSNAWWVVLAVVGYSALSIFWALDREIAIDRVLKLAVFLPAGTVLVLVALQSFDVGGDVSRKFLLSGFSMGVLLLVWAIASFGPIGTLVPPDLHYIQGYSGENRGAVILVLLATACLLAARRMVSPSWVWGVALCVGTLLMLAASQTAFAAFLVWFAVLAAASAYPALVKQLVIWGGAAFILIQPFLVLAIEWADPTRSFDIEVASVGARLDIWIAVAHKAMEAPIFGHGLEATRSITDWVNDFRYFAGRDIPHPHNGILQIWIEFGVMGALAFALIWVILVRSLNAFVQADQAALLAFASALLLVMGISHGLWQSWWIWGAFGVVAVTLTQARRDHSLLS